MKNHSQGRGYTQNREEKMKSKEFQGVCNAACVHRAALMCQQWIVRIFLQTTIAKKKNIRSESVYSTSTKKMMSVFFFRMSTVMKQQ